MNNRFINIFSRLQMFNFIGDAVPPPSWISGFWLLFDVVPEGINEITHPSLAKPDAIPEPLFNLHVMVAKLRHWNLSN